MSAANTGTPAVWIDRGGDLPSSRLERDDRLLGVMRYGAGLEAGGPSTLPCCHVPLQVLDGPAAALIWRGARSTIQDTLGAVVFRCDGETLFGTYVDEGVGPEQIEQATLPAYTEVFKVADQAGYPYVYRVWNYLPDINTDWNGLEIYKSFCIGRQRAFDATPIARGMPVPAACAIGTGVPGLRMCFLASKQPAVQLSNPRQLEAYHYPVQYGPRSPAFSRAVRVRPGGSHQLHVSGTASIVGHATRHHDEIDAQVGETLTNLDALLRQVGIGLGDLDANALLTVYLRRRADLAAVRARLLTAVAPAAACLFLQGDICRRSLLVEIEGIIPLAGVLPLPAADPEPN